MNAQKWILLLLQNIVVPKDKFRAVFKIICKKLPDCFPGIVKAAVEKISEYDKSLWFIVLKQM